MSDVWKEHKRVLLENIFIYSVSLVLFVGLDFGINLLRLFIGHLAGVSLTGHPYQFGVFQAMGALFSSIQLARNIYAYRYCP